jgi:hypothetical protein
VFVYIPWSFPATNSQSTSMEAHFISDNRNLYIANVFDIKLLLPSMCSDLCDIQQCHGQNALVNLLNMPSNVLKLYKICPPVVLVTDHFFVVSR